MTDESPKDLSKEFTAAAETQKLVSAIESIINRFEVAQRGNSNAVLDVTVTSTLIVLKEACLEIAKNQVRQDKKIASLEARIEELENGGRVTRLDKKQQGPK